MRALRGSVYALGALLGAALILGGLFVRRPQVFLGDRSAGFLLGRFGAEYRPVWSQLSFSARWLGGWRHRYALSLRDLCLSDASGGFDACFDEFDLRVTAAFSRGGVRLEQVERFVALGRGLRARTGGAAAPAGGAAALMRTRVEEARVDLASVTVVDGEAVYAGRLSLRLDRSVPRPFTLSADFLRSAAGEKPSRLGLEASAESDAFRPEGATFIKAAARVDLAAAGRGKGTMSVRRTTQGYEAQGAGVFTGGALGEARLTDCRGQASAAPQGGPPTAASVRCRFHILPLRSGAGRIKGVGALAGNLLFDGALEAEGYTARIEAALDPVKTWFQAVGRFGLEAEGRVGSAPRILEATAELETAQAHFEDLVALLRDTPQSIPAPFHVLTGPVHLKASAHGDPRADNIKAHLALGAELAGSRQRLSFEAGADLVVVRPWSARRGIDLAADVIIKEGMFELPHLDVATVPAPSFDQRIKTGADAQPPARPPVASTAAAPALNVRMSLRTEKPLLLLSNLVKEPVPVSLDLAGTYPPASLGGKVLVRPFELELFRRTAAVDHLDAVIVPGSKSVALEGLLVYTARDAVISIRVLGTMEKPRLEFSSVPPLRREDILALLIFGKNPAELDPEESSSVGNTETALQAQAFGLASLYLFGATPIEHVAYDPGSKNVTVKLRLPGGARLQLGSDFERSRELRLRQPLAPHWAIQSEFSEADAQSRFGTTFLEWFNRY